MYHKNLVLTKQGLYYVAQGRFLSMAEEDFYSGKIFLLQGRTLHILI